MKRRRSILALLVGAAADVLTGCSSDAPEPGPTTSAAPRPPVPVPSDLLGVCLVPAPAALFQLLRKSYDLPIAGSSWASFAVGALGLPITASEAFDLDAPLRVVLLPALGDSFQPAFALPLRAPDRLIAVATLGESAPFRAEKDDALRGERLSATSGGQRRELGVLRNHLVVGPAGALARVGAFLSDPEEPLFAQRPQQLSGWLHGRVLAELVASLLERFNERQQALLREGLPGFTELTGALRSIAEISFEASLSETASALRFSLPKTDELGAALGSLTAGELAPMLAADRDASFAVGLYQALADRVKAAERLGMLLPPLGFVSQPEGALRDALIALARARSDGFQLAIERGPAGALAFGSCDLADEDAARAALSALTKASGEPKSEDSASVRFVGTRLTLIGEAVHFVIEREAPANDPKAEQSKRRMASILMRVESGRLALGTGTDGVMALKKALRRRAEEGPAALSDLSVVKAIVPVLPQRAALYAFFDPARWFSDSRPSGDPERDRSAMALALEITADGVGAVLALEPFAARALARRVLAGPQSGQGTL